MPPERRTAAIDDRLRVEHMLEAARDALQYDDGRTREDLTMELE